MTPRSPTQEGRPAGHDQNRPSRQELRIIEQDLQHGAEEGRWDAEDNETERFSDRGQRDLDSELRNRGRRDLENELDLIRNDMSTMTSLLHQLLSRDYVEPIKEEDNRNSHLTQRRETTPFHHQTSQRTDYDEENRPTSPGANSVRSSVVSQQVSAESLLKATERAVPMFAGDIRKPQALFEFIRKTDSYFRIAELPPRAEVVFVTGKLTGTADLWWGSLVE
ncbi:hypothetical protein DFS34DRAFT_605366, partial [Phlyctochytrium arcticum]